MTLTEYPRYVANAMRNSAARLVQEAQVKTAEGPIRTIQRGTMTDQYQVMPALTPEEYAALKASIAEYGVLLPIQFDDEDNVLDGHHRLRACEELGIKDYPSIIRVGLSEDEKIELIVALNLDRRHLTPEQRQEIVVNLREQGWSLRRIGESLAVDEGTVRGDLARAEYSAPEKVTGKDGKSYPARRPGGNSNVVGSSLAGNEEAWKNIYRSESNEWYTPIEYLDSARAVLGAIDVDPASAEPANEIVQAVIYYTAETDGPAHDWPGRVWLNPPWGGAQAIFVNKLLQQFDAGITHEAILLVNAHSTDTTWFRPFWDHILCFTDHRINFGGTEGGGSTHGSVFIYLGPNSERFAKEFRQWGAVVVRVPHDYSQ